MTELDALIAGAAGGSLSAMAMTLALLGHMKYCYEKKLEALQLQLVALRVELNVGYRE